MPSTAMPSPFSYLLTNNQALATHEGYRFGGWDRDWLLSMLVVVADSIGALSGPFQSDARYYVIADRCIAIDFHAAKLLDVDHVYLAKLLPHDKLIALFRGDREALVA